MTLQTRLSRGEQVACRNSQITNVSMVRHNAGHDRLPFELIWAYGHGAERQVVWAFFPGAKAAAQAADDLMNAVRDRTTGAVR